MTRRGLLITGFALVAALATSAGIASGSNARDKAATLNGAGSSFVFPLVSAWVPAFESASGIKVNYNPIGTEAASQRSRIARSTSVPATPRSHPISRRPVITA